MQYAVGPEYPVAKSKECVPSQGDKDTNNPIMWVSCRVSFNCLLLYMIHSGLGTCCVVHSPFVSERLSLQCSEQQLCPGPAQMWLGKPALLEWWGPEQPLTQRFWQLPQFCWHVTQPGRLPVH